MGQVWELTPFDDAVLSQVGEREFVADDPSLIGGGGHFVFRFEGRSAGTTAVEMILYFRGIESTDPGSRFSVTVTVR